MPEISEDQVRWMRNRFVDMLERIEVIAADASRIQDELNRVIDALSRLLPSPPDEAGRT